MSETQPIAGSGCARPCPGGEVIGHEIRGVYDGVLFWSCSACGEMWHRWSPEVNDYRHGKAEEVMANIRQVKGRGAGGVS